MSRIGNLRGAPLFLRPSVVRGLVEGVDAIRKGLVQVPIAPIKLVDRPRRSEDPRLAKANDDSKASGWVATPVASEPEDWPDAPLPDHADPDLDRLAPAEDRALVAESEQRIRAPRQPKSAPTGAELVLAERNERLLAACAAGTPLAELVAEFRLKPHYIRFLAKQAGVKVPPKTKAPRAPKQPKPVRSIPPVEQSGLEGTAARESASQTQLATPQPAHDCGEKRSPTIIPKPAAPTGPGFYSEPAIKRRLQNAGRARSAEEVRQAKAHRSARRAELAAEADKAAAEFAEALERVRARRESGVEIIVRKPAAPIHSGAKLAEAIRHRDAMKVARPAEAKRPLEPAPSRDECLRCGIPGWKGCDHQLPFIETVDRAALGQANSGPRV